MTNMLSVTDLDVNYGSSQVLFQLKLHVKKGTEWRDAKTAWIKQNGEWI